jgi:hypothetical protein
VSRAFAVVVRTMLKIARWHMAIVTGCIVSASLTACGGNANVPSTPIAAAPFAQSRLQPQAGPARCKGQTGTTEFAAAMETLRASGGVLCVPAFANFGGTLEYPRVQPPGSFQITSSTTNFDSIPPPVGVKAKALFYVQFVTAAPTTFGSTFRKTGALVGKSIKAGKTYSVYGNAQSHGPNMLITPFPPCYAVAKAGAGGGTLTPFGSVLAGQKLLSPATIALAVYANKLPGAKKC